MNEHKSMHDEHAHGTSHSAEGQAVKDPVCGMNINPPTAVGRQEHGGRTYYFCSAHCLEKFRAEPGKYAK